MTQHFCKLIKSSQPFLEYLGLLAMEVFATNPALDDIDFLLEDSEVKEKFITFLQETKEDYNKQFIIDRKMAISTNKITAEFISKFNKKECFSEILTNFNSKDEDLEMTIFIIEQLNTLKKNLQSSINFIDKNKLKQELEKLISILK